MATPAAMSHDSAMHAKTDDHKTSSYTFDADDLDLSLNRFSKMKSGHMSMMSEPDEEQEHSSAQDIQVPDHPIPSMQAAFAESMRDAFQGTEDKPDQIADSVERRAHLLAQDTGEATHAARWKQKPGQKYHELWKLVAQISFGIYLLLNGMARDDDQALNILQKHVDEVDGFLEATLEDFDLAQEDIEQRLANLKLPLENIILFDKMLEARGFRNDIVAGNERIEHIITRTASAMNDSLRSVQRGMEATREFAKYMAEMENRKDWQEEREDEDMKLVDKHKLFDAMNGNADGWYKAFVLLQTKGNHLGVSLVQLGTIVAEIDKRAAEISRRSRFSLAMSPRKPSWNSGPASASHSRKNSAGHSQHSKHSTRPSIASLSKNLPADPSAITPAIAATLPAFQMVSERQRTPQPPEDEDHEDSATEASEAVQYLTLQPRAYTPPPLTPSRYTPPTTKTAFQPPTPEPEHSPMMPIPAKSSLRKRLSKQQKSTPPPLLTAATYSASSSQRSLLSSTSSSNNRSQRSSHHSRTRSQSMSNVPTPSPQHKAQDSVATQYTIPITRDFPRPPTISFGPSYDGSERSHSSSPMRQHPIHPRPQTQQTQQNRDSDYYDHSNPDSRVTSMAGSLAGTPSMEYHAFIASSQPTRPDFSAGGNYVSSPRSEQHMTFQPVMASPHSPLQRPWTAAPENRGPPGRHPHMLQANAHSYSANAMLTVNNGGGVRGSNMSTMTRASEMTVGVGPDGKKIKKKRSGFGWLKKAFSLSEEEKAEFEEKRRREYAAEEEWRNNQPRERVFLDGKRIYPKGTSERR